MSDFNTDAVDYSVYVILDREKIRGRPVRRLTEQIIRGGATIIQYRDKVSETGPFCEQAMQIYEVTEKHRIPLLINDRLDIALASGAAGIHIGQTDMPLRLARKLLGSKRLVGLSISRPEQVSSAEGADYLGVGAVFPTHTKVVKGCGGPALIRKVREQTTLPLVGIGGITAENAEMVIKAGCDGVSVISCVLDAVDAEKAVRQLADAVRKAKKQI